MMRRLGVVATDDEGMAHSIAVSKDIKVKDFTQFPFVGSPTKTLGP